MNIDVRSDKPVNVTVVKPLILKQAYFILNQLVEVERRLKNILLQQMASFG
ncbi:hypothetical protein D3C85_1490770 [compost metagenome]